MNNDFQSSDFIHTGIQLLQVGQCKPPGKEDHPEKAQWAMLVRFKRDLWKSFDGVCEFLYFKKSKSLRASTQSPLKLPFAEHFPSTEIRDHAQCKEGLALCTLGSILQGLGAPKVLCSALVGGGILAITTTTTPKQMFS